MKIKILFFASLVEISQLKELEIEDCTSLSALKSVLASRYPEIDKTTYSIAVNQEINPPSTMLKDGDVVALLPPFSGG